MCCDGRASKGCPNRSRPVGILLGGLTSLLYGVGDFLGGEGAKRAPAASVVLWAGVVSFPLIAGVALLVGGSATAADMWLGAVGGAAGVLGLVMLFAGLGRGHAAAVAPASAAVGAIIPVIFGIVGGERPSLLAWSGVAVAIPAVVLSSSVADGVSASGLRFGIAAGIGFGGYAVILDRTSDASALLPLVSARGSAMAFIGLIALLGLWDVTRFAEVPALIVAANGVLDVAGNVTLLLALRSGSLALVGVAASFYPAVTVILARLINSEHLRARQIAGVVLTLVSLSVIAVA